jgi:hypothetical protein
LQFKGFVAIQDVLDQGWRRSGNTDKIGRFVGAVGELVEHRKTVSYVF